MSNKYTLQTTVDYKDISAAADPAVFYWTWDVTISTYSGVAQKPFLLECFLPADTDLSSVSAVNKQLVRVLTPGDLHKYPEDTDITSSTTAGWVSFRASAFSCIFYTYRELKAKEAGVRSILKTHTRQYTSGVRDPLHVRVLNISDPKVAIPEGFKMLAYEGDVLSVVPSGGTGEVTVSYTPDYLDPLTLLNKTHGSTALLYKVKDITDDIGSGATLNIVVTDNGTAESVTLATSIVRPSNYGSNTEVV